MKGGQLVLLLLIAPAALADWETMVLYDVLPEACRDDVANKDVGNVPGDMYFMMKDKYLPYACPYCEKHPWGCYHDAAAFDCTNPESGGDLVVRKIEIEINTAYGDYALCDEWHSTNASNCSDYECFTFSKSPKPGVGIEQVAVGGEMAPRPTRFQTAAFDYWNWNAAALLGNTTGGGGLWYSLDAKNEGEYWRNATVVKAITADCHAQGLDSTVEQAGSACFDACEQPSNTSSACWIQCFFATALGPTSNTTFAPDGGPPTGAMSVEALSKGWLQGFASDDVGLDGRIVLEDAKRPSVDILLSPPKVTARTYLDVGIGGSPAGRIEIDLFGELCPRAAENFRQLATGQNGFGYAGSSFYTVISNLTLQAGGIPDGPRSIYGPTFTHDNYAIKHNVAGLVSCVNSGVGGGSQESDSRFLVQLVDDAGFLDGRYEAFGRVTAGMEVVRRIEQVRVAGAKNAPVDRVTIDAAGVLP